MMRITVGVGSYLVGAALASLLAAAFLSPAATARTEGQAIEGNCRAKAVVLLFWPQGHAELITGGQPASRVPHVELFRHAGNRTYLPSNQIGYADANGRFRLEPACRRKREQSRFYDVRPARETRRAATIACTVPGGALVHMRNSGTGGAELRVMDPPNKVILLALLGRSSRVVHSRWLCGTGAPPR
jgi:hypothetical protein